MKPITTLIIGLALACGALAQEAKENPKQALQSLMERARDAKAAGRYDEAKELAEQAEKIQRELHEHEGLKKPEKHAEKHPGKEIPPPFKGGPEAGRLEHVMQAVQHLHAAGLHEPAQNIEQIAQHMRREMEERMRREQAEAHAKEGKHPGGEKIHAEMEEMRQQLRKLAEQIEQLQAKVKQQQP